MNNLSEVIDSVLNNYHPQDWIIPTGKYKEVDETFSTEAYTYRIRITNTKIELTSSIDDIGNSRVKTFHHYAFNTRKNNDERSIWFMIYDYSYEHRGAFRTNIYFETTRGVFKEKIKGIFFNESFTHMVFFNEAGFPDIIPTTLWLEARKLVCDKYFEVLKLLSDKALENYKIN